MRTIKMIEHFGAFCANSSDAIRYVNYQITPILSLNDTIEFDFSGIRNMSSSFSNALFANLAEEYGENILKRIHFVNCRDNVKVLISSALKLGLSERDKLCKV